MSVGANTELYKMSTVQTLQAMSAGLRRWPLCIAQAALMHLFRLEIAPTWETRRGTRVSLLPGDGSWFSVVENICLDVYGVSHMQLAGEGATFLDVGANIGTTTLAVCEHAPAIRCVAYEPGRRAFDKLVENVQHNGLAERVKCVQAAIVGSDRDGVVRLFEPDHDTPTNVLEELRTRERRGKWSVVPAVPLAQAIEECGERVNLLKMDIEGAEYGVIGGTSRAVLSLVDAIVMEYHPVAGHSPFDLRDRLAKVGFELVRHASVNGSRVGFLWFQNTAQKRPG